MIMFIYVKTSSKELERPAVGLSSVGLCMVLYGVELLAKCKKKASMAYKGLTFFKDLGDGHGHGHAAPAIAVMPTSVRIRPNGGRSSAAHRPMDERMAVGRTIMYGTTKAAALKFYSSIGEPLQQVSF